MGVSTTPFSCCSPMAFRKATDFHELSLYNVILLKLLVLSTSFLTEYFESDMSNIVSSENKDNFTFSFLFLTLKFPLFCFVPDSECLEHYIEKERTVDSFMIFLVLLGVI